MQIAEIWSSIGLMGKVVVLALAAMWVMLAVMARDLNTRARHVTAETVRLRDLKVRQRQGERLRTELRSVERQARQLNGQLDERVWSLVGMVWGAPLVGFFGTLLGMLNAFTHVAQGGPVTAARFSAGAAEALVTSLVGLALAMVAAWLWAFYRKRAVRLGFALVAAVEDLAEPAP